MWGLLVVVGTIAAVLYVFMRVLRSRVQRRMDTVDLPAELVAAQRAAHAPRPVVPGAPAAAAVGRPVLVTRSQGAPHFMLIYDVAPDFMQRRAQFRDEHLTLAWKAADAGELVLAGALEEPAAHAFLLFQGSREAALRFAAADPYVKQGLVKAFRVKQWHTTVGSQAAAPLRPQG
jgi:uncharacterized protein